MLKFLLAIFVFIAGSTTSFAGELVKNSSLGFEIQLPDGWSKATADQFYENLGKVKLGDAKLQEMLAKSANIPVVLVTKFPEPYPDLNPSLKINVRPYGRIPSRDPVEIVGFMLNGLKKVFPDLVVIDPPAKVMLGGANAAHVKVTYDLKTEAASYPTASELWLVPSEHFFFMIGLGYSQDDAKSFRSEAEASIQSLKFDLD